MAKLHPTISLPSKLQVSGLTIALRCQEQLQEIADDEGSYHAGKQLIVFDEAIIRQQSSYSCILVWHELFHVVYEQYNLKEKKEEDTVNAMSRGIVQILKDNPQLKKWMDQCLKK